MISKRKIINCWEGPLARLKVRNSLPGPMIWETLPVNFDITREVFMVYCLSNIKIKNNANLSALFFKAARLFSIFKEEMGVFYLVL